MVTGFVAVPPVASDVTTFSLISWLRLPTPPFSSQESPKLLRMKGFAIGGLESRESVVLSSPPVSRSYKWTFVSGSWAVMMRSPDQNVRNSVPVAWLMISSPMGTESGLIDRISITHINAEQRPLILIPRFLNGFLDI